MPAKPYVIATAEMISAAITKRALGWGIGRTAAFLGISNTCFLRIEREGSLGSAATLAANAKRASGGLVISSQQSGDMAFMLALGVTQQKVADCYNISQSSVSKLVRTKRIRPSPSSWARRAQR